MKPKALPPRSPSLVNPEKEGIPAYIRPLRPHNNRRAAFHDYKRPSSYLITFNKSPEAPDFSILIGNPASLVEPPVAVPTRAGQIIATFIEKLKENPAFRIPRYVIMPDHVHIVWQVVETLPKDLGYYVGLLKTKCTAVWRNPTCLTAQKAGLAPKMEISPSLDSDCSIPGPSCNLQGGEQGGSEQRGAEQRGGEHGGAGQKGLKQASKEQKGSLFMEKFNDRIAFDEKTYRNFLKYVEDNPRRRLTVIRFPHLFQRVQNIRILDRIYTAFGNFQLLQEPVIAVAVVSSRFTPAEKAANEGAVEEALRTGGVLISPFISKAEKELMSRAIDEGASIIRIIPDGLGERYKPSGKEFELCQEGRCLHIGVPRESQRKESLRRDECLRLNRVCFWLASHPAERMSILGGARR